MNENIGLANGNTVELRQIKDIEKHISNIYGI